MECADATISEDLRWCIRLISCLYECWINCTGLTDAHRIFHRLYVQCFCANIQDKQTQLHILWKACICLPEIPIQSAVNSW